MKGELAALGAAAAWACGGVIIKPVTERFDPFAVNFLRAGTGCLFFLTLTLPFGVIPRINPSTFDSLLYLVGSGIMGVAIGTSLYLKSLGITEVSRVHAVSFSSWILITAVIAWSLLAEPFTGRTISGALLVVLGVALLVGAFERRKANPRSQALRGGLLALASGACWAGGTILLKFALYDLDPLEANVVRLPVIALSLLPAVLLRGRSSDLREMLRGPGIFPRVGAAGVLDQAVGALLFFIAIRDTGAARATVLSSLSPLFVLPFSVLLLREKPGRTIVLGVVLSVAGACLISAS